MFNPIPGGTKEIISNWDGYDFTCWIPPLGYGVNSITGNVEKTDIIKRSIHKSEQYWERTPLPEDWKKRRTDEARRKLKDPDYDDPVCLQFQNQEWRRRLNGVWFYNNGKPTYITGRHYMYLNWWCIDIGYPHYRSTDRKVFLVVEYCYHDPACGGLLEATKRRQGKTYRAGCLLFEEISRKQDCEGGLQSKTSTDAKNVFQKAIVTPFKRLPDFFRPVFDTSKGVTPTSELKFAHTTKKGSKALDDLDKPELNSLIDWASSDVFGYDGRKKVFLVEDEVGKTKEANVYERSQVNRYCLETDGAWTGFAYKTTTVEEMTAGGENFMKLWKDSDPRKRDDNGHTASGLYCFMTPAYDTLYYDKYGEADTEKGKQYFLNRRAGLAHDQRALSSEIRKNPFTVQEMFRIDGEKCPFNSMKLNEQRDYLSWNKDLVERVNLEWENGIRDSKIIVVPNPHGRWRMARAFQPAPDEVNNVIKRGGQFLPANSRRFPQSLDPYDHETTEDGRQSRAASLVKMKYDIKNPEHPLINGYVLLYLARPATAELMYEDMVKQMFYTSAEMLVENNKPGFIKYARNRGYGAFLMYVGYKEPGIPSTPENKNAAMDLVEAQVENHYNKIMFIEVIDDWLPFDVRNTQPFDAGMTGLWTEYADAYKDRKPKENIKTPEVAQYFRSYKINA